MELTNNHNQIAVPDMIRQWVGGDYTALGTDGFGRSDTRPNLRKFFEIDSQSITLVALSSLQEWRNQSRGLRQGNERPWSFKG